RFVLQQHMKIHTGKLYKCIESGCIFAGRSFGELKIHYQTHFDEKNFQCKKCDYRGKTKQQLARHSTIHEGTKKFKCPSCPFTARTSYHLKRHSRLHTGCKPYSCPHCNYKCNSLENLRKHILSTNKHPGKSIYECKFCMEKPFRTNLFMEFKAHLLTLHSEEMDREGKASNGVYEAGKDKFFSIGNRNRPIAVSDSSNAEPTEEVITVQIPEVAQISLDSTSSQVHGDDVLPMISLIVSKQEEPETENWSLIGCYDVEESGELVPFTKDVNEDVLFEEHF
ncbi:hypothetical protein HHI36_008788, partial [Cryptolaemus montrouzieri]